MPFLDRVQHQISAADGTSVTLGAVYAANALTITQAGGVNGALYSYVISDGNKFELQKQQAYNSGTGKMARGTPVLAWDGSTASTTQLSSLSGSAVFAIDLLAEDLTGFASKDGNSNFSANNLIDGFATTATAAGTTTLTVASAGIQVFTGTTTQTVALPTTSIVAGYQALVINGSTGAVTVQSSGGNTVVVLPAGASAVLTALVATPTTAANWNANGGFATAAQFLSNTAGKVLDPAAVWGAGAVSAITLKANATVTITNASPGVVTDTAHGFLGNEPVRFTTTGGLPTGLTASVEYYVVTGSITTNTYQVSATVGGSAINTTSTGSGTITREALVLLDGNVASNFSVTPNRNFALGKPRNWKAGQSGRLTVTQDGTGSRLMTYQNQAAGGWGTAGGTAITLSTAASTKDKIWIDAESSTDVVLNAGLAIA